MDAQQLFQYIVDQVRSGNVEICGATRPTMSGGDDAYEVRFHFDGAHVAVVVPKDPSQQCYVALLGDTVYETVDVVGP